MYQGGLFSSIAAVEIHLQSACLRKLKRQKTTSGENFSIRLFSKNARWFGNNETCYFELVESPPSTPKDKHTAVLSLTLNTVKLNKLILNFSLLLI